MKKNRSIKAGFFGSLTVLVTSWLILAFLNTRDAPPTLPEPSPADSTEQVPAMPEGWNIHGI